MEQFPITSQLSPNTNGRTALWKISCAQIRKLGQRRAAERVRFSQMALLLGGTLLLLLSRLRARIQTERKKK